MIIGIGIDTIEIARFLGFSKRKNLSRIFSLEELKYCFAVSQKTAERLALRFAVKEAFFKASSTIFSHHRLPQPPLLTICKAVSYVTINGQPDLIINWDLLQLPAAKNLKILVSATHSQTTATAVVILEQL